MLAVKTTSFEGKNRAQVKSPTWPRRATSRDEGDVSETTRARPLLPPRKSRKLLGDAARTVAPPLSRSELRDSGKLTRVGLISSDGHAMRSEI